MAVSPIAWRPCCLRTIQRPLAASPCGRLSRPRSTISQSDCRRVIGPFLPFGLGGPYKLSLEPGGSPLFTWDLLMACWRYEPRKHLKVLAIPGDMVSCAFKAQPSQTRTYRFPASGSSRESFAHSCVAMSDLRWREG